MSRNAAQHNAYLAQRVEENALGVVVVGTVMFVSVVLGHNVEQSAPSPEHIYVQTGRTMCYTLPHAVRYSSHHRTMDCIPSKIFRAKWKCSTLLNDSIYAWTGRCKLTLVPPKLCKVTRHDDFDDNPSTWFRANSTCDTHNDSKRTDQTSQT